MVDFRIFLICSSEVEANPEEVTNKNLKWNQLVNKPPLLCIKHIMEQWFKLMSKDLKFAMIVVGKEEKKLILVLSVKVKELSLEWCNWVQECTLRVKPIVITVQAKEKWLKRVACVRLVKAKELTKFLRKLMCQLM